jgi:NCS1 family nucleobase:cation symporter-1
VGVVPHLPGFLHTVNPKIKVSAGAEHMYLLTAISSFAISKRNKTTPQNVHANFVAQVLP